MGEAFLLDGVAEGADDMILPEDVLECPRAVFSSKDLITHVGDDSQPGGFVMVAFA